MLVFGEPFKPKRVDVPKPSEDAERERRAQEEAARRARAAAAAGGGRDASIVAGAANPRTRLRQILGIG